VLAGGAKSAGFIASFHAAALVGCALCLLAGLSAFVLVRSEGAAVGPPPKRRAR